MWRPTVTVLPFLHDSVTTRRVSHDRGGLVEETAIQVESRVVVPGVELVDTALAPARGRVEGDGGSHDTPGCPIWTPTGGWGKGGKTNEVCCEENT